MTAVEARPWIRRRALVGRTVVLLGGADGMGAGVARLAGAAGAQVVLADPDPTRIERFVDRLAEPVDHLVVAAGGPHGTPPTESDSARERRDVDELLWLPVRVARAAVGRVRPGGTLLFLGGTPARAQRAAVSLAGALEVARRALIPSLALEVAPVRVNLIGARLVDRPLSARLLGGTLVHGDDLSSTPRTARVVRPSDVAELAVHLMLNPAVTGATYDLDAGPPGK